MILEGGGDGDLGRAAAIAAEHGIRRVMAVHGQADEADGGEAPVSLATLAEAQVAGLSAGAAAKQENLLRVRRHGLDSITVQGGKKATGTV